MTLPHQGRCGSRARNRVGIGDATIAMNATVVANEGVGRRARGGSRWNRSKESKSCKRSKE